MEFYCCPQRFLRSYYINEDLNIYEILMYSGRGKISALNEPICKEEKAEFLIAIDCSGIALIAISFSPLLIMDGNEINRFILKGNQAFD